MLGRHDATGALLRVREESANIIALLFLHEAQDLFAAHGREVGNRVGRFVWTHLLEQVGNATWLKVFEQVGARLWLQLFERFCSSLIVERVHDVGAVARRQLIDDRREIGRVQLREAGVRHAEAYARNR